MARHEPARGRVVKATVLADTLEIVADECRDIKLVYLFGADADALLAAAQRASDQTRRLARRIERARGWRWRLRHLTGRSSGSKR